MQASSGPGIFRFDRNNEFIEGVLRPAVDAERHEALCRFGEDWRKRFRLTLSLSAGAPARVAALSASLQSYRPTLLHAVELKHFWHSGQLSRGDLECHEYSVVSSHPPVRAELLPEPLRWMVSQLRAHHRQFTAVREGPYRGRASSDRLPRHPLAGRGPGDPVAGGGAWQDEWQWQRNDMATFWMRKSRKPVLAVLLVRKQRVAGSRPAGASSSSSSAGSSGLQSQPDGSSAGSQGSTGKPLPLLQLPEPASGIQAISGERGGVVFREDPSSEYFAYRGLNMEVSMPTGSLCSERAAIASALANDPSLLRSECVAIAVLSSTLLPECSWKHAPHSGPPKSHHDRTGSESESALAARGTEKRAGGSGSSSKSSSSSNSGGSSGDRQTNGRVAAVVSPGIGTAT